MAAVETELKSLNKTVSEAVQMLKIYIGSSSQLKNIGDKQRNIIEKWLDVVEMEGENQKRQRAFTERERDETGRFIKKQDDQASKFMGIAKSIGGLFKKMAKGIGNSIMNISKGITMHLTGIFQTIKSHFLGLFGEESEWFDLLSSIKDSVKGFVGSFTRGVLMIFRRTPTWAGKMIKYLKDMYKLQIKQMKADFLKGAGIKKKNNSIWSILGVILFSIAAGIGAWLHRKLIALKIFGVFGKLGKFFAALEKFPLLGKVIRGLKFGFKWLGWPLTILLSVIDFIEGFSKTQGTLWDKIKGGLWEALKGFLDLPIRFISWVIEKVAGFFGIELNNVSQKIMDGLHTAFNFLLDLPIKISMAVKTAVNTLLDRMKSWVDPLMSVVTPIITGVHNFFVDFWNIATEWIASKIPSWLPGSETIIEGLKGMKLNKIKLPESSPAETVAEADKKKIEEKKKSDKTMEDILKSMGENIQDNKRSTGNIVTAMSNMQSNNSRNNVDTQQIPDELDNNALAFGNYGGGFD